jgi:hypothetical protein
MLAAVEEFQMEGFFTRDAAYTKHWKLAFLSFPPTIPLPGQTQQVRYFFAADDAFAMRHYIMKPYPFKDESAPNRIFNYWLSRTRRIVENMFGIIANRYHVLRKPLIQNPHRHCKYCASGLCSAQYSDVNTRTDFLSTVWIIDTKITHS